MNPNFKPKSPQIKFWAALGLMLLLVVVDFHSGSFRIPLNQVLRLALGFKAVDPQWVEVFYAFRLPRVVTAICAGAALPVAGVLMQALFRNPLASPSELGITSGASLAVAILVMGIGSATGNSNVTGSGFSTWWSQLPPSVAAFGTAGVAALGSAAMLLVILAFAARVTQPATLLIAGLLISNVVGAFIGLLQWGSGADQMRAFTYWGMGSLNGVDGTRLLGLMPLVILGLILAMGVAKPLNALVLGEETAQGLGVSVRKIRLLILFTASLLTGAVTAFCGPIAFLGLAVPHLARVYLGRSDHRLILPISMILGATLLLLCDALSQWPAHGGVLPINALTALLGAPVILWMVLHREAE